jgi:hypothetical protein
MTNGVHTLMEAMQSTTGSSPRDRCSTQTRFEKLPVRSHSMLPSGNTRDLQIGLVDFVSHSETKSQIGLVDFVSHSETKSPSTQTLPLRSAQGKVAPDLLCRAGGRDEVHLEM